MSDRDDELERLLKPLDSRASSEFQVRKWQKAIRQERALWHGSRGWKGTARLVAAAMVGFVLGVGWFSYLQSERADFVASYFTPPATIEQTFTSPD